MSEGNGTRRPFGPHGEDCTCDEEEFSEEESSEEEYTNNDPLTQEERNYERVFDLAFESIASTIAENFLSGLDNAMLEGAPLNRKQVVATLGAVMTGYAEAKEVAMAVESALREFSQKARAARRAAEEEEHKEEKKPDLHSVTDLFKIPPQTDDDDE